MDLLPCPFCGEKYLSKALNKKTFCQLHGEPSQSFCIACINPKCHAQPRVSRGDKFNGGEQKAYLEAAAAWNTRQLTQDKGEL